MQEIRVKILTPVCKRLYNVVRWFSNSKLAALHLCEFSGGKLQPDGSGVRHIRYAHFRQLGGSDGTR